MAYLDTSVLAAYYCPEPLSAKVQRVLLKLESPAVSPLNEIELASALSLKVRMGQMDGPAASKVLSMFQVHISQSCYKMLSIHPREFALARDWIGRFSTPLRTLDALHLAASFSRGLTLITADRGLATSARALDLKFQLIA